MKYKMISTICVLSLLFSTISTPLFADNVTQNSTPSTNTNISDGEDFTQGETTVYSDVVGSDKNEASDVYASQASTFAAMIPKVIVLNGKTGEASYEVYAKGNIGGIENVYIVPDETFFLNDTKNIKHSLMGNVFQNKTAFSWNDVMNEQKSTSQGNIIVPNISAGNWSGCIYFDIYLQNNLNKVEDISLVDTTIVNEETNAIQILSNTEKEVGINVYPEQSNEQLKIYSSSPYVSATISNVNNSSAMLDKQYLINAFSLSNEVFATNGINSKKMKLNVQVSNDAPCNLNATITIKARMKTLSIPILVEHTFDNVNIIKVATCTETGEKELTCSKCGYKKKIIEKTSGHNIISGVCSNCGISVDVTYTFTGTTITYQAPTGGKVDVFVAPIDGTYQLETWGARGGVTTSYGSSYEIAGSGGYAKGNIYLEKDQKIYICVGSIGGWVADHAGSAGGYNGGGNGGFGRSYGGCGGGGATSITTTNRGILSNFNNYRDEVLIVAGGGGGALYGWSNSGAYGGIEGGSGCGYDVVSTWPKGGTQTTGYAFGQGGHGRSGTKTTGGTLGASGGGGGWYGGFARTYAGVNSNAQGGGGSSYVGGVSNPTTASGINYGNGKAVIKLIG